MKTKTLQFSLILFALVCAFNNSQGQGNRRSSFRVDAPLSIQGYKIIDEADSLASNPSPWGTSVDSAWENIPVAFDPANLDGCAAFPVGFFNGKFALINRGSCEFGVKALAAQQAGARGVIIVNNLLGVVGMGAGASGASVEIPVIMVTTTDGAAMRNELILGNNVTISLTDWRFNPMTNPVDIGFMNDGPIMPTGRTIPTHQLSTASATDENFRLYAGSRFYNFSTNTWDTLFQKGVLSYNPSLTGGAFTPKDSNSVSWNFTSPPTTTDSILAVVIDTIGTTLMGFDLNDELIGKYKMVNTMSTLPNTETPSALLNNTWSYDFAIHDSIYSKSEYNFTTNAPVVNSYVNTGAAVEWGPMLYIRNGGYGARKAQVVVMRDVIDDSVFAGQEAIVTLSKWTDGNNDSLIDHSTELDEVATGSYMLTATDIIPIGGKVLTMNLSNTVSPGKPIILEADSKYWLRLTNLGNPAGTTNFSIGADYYSDYSANLAFDLSDGNPLFSGGSMFSGGFANAGAPAMALHMSKLKEPNAVNDINTIDGTVKVYPNPTSNIVHISVNLNKVSNKVTYELVDISGKTISSVTHNNVQNEIHSFNISQLAVGSYFVNIITDEGTQQTKIAVSGK